MTDRDSSFITLIGAHHPDSADGTAQFEVEAEVEQDGKTLVHALATFALVAH